MNSSGSPPSDASAPDAVARRAAGSASALAARAGPPLAVAVLAVVAWWAAARTAAVPDVIFPTPFDVGRALADHWPALVGAAGVTAVTAGLGVLGGALVGVLLATAMTVSETTRAVVRPYVVALRVVPVVAVAPLLFRWFGDGVPARALLAATLAVFPVTIATHQGLAATPDEYLALARSVGASSADRYLRVRLPAAAPQAFAGLKIAAAAGVVGAVVSEFLTLKAGIGYRVFRASTRLQTARMVAALFVLALLGVAFYLVPALAERRVDWG
ncbi:ABC transporter permease subunit [Halorussus limi]|uniref:ABC transporter permease subunit n=1 Tax=Halorussus limi TaxID=2938695 RepID=A0A8U0HRQ0_9EURY|nr:ABC transporter permease subunit [Halorussus limi]UPV73630.1 ABC transporter permease subunit [Halorussus limi]